MDVFTYTYRIHLLWNDIFGVIKLQENVVIYTSKLVNEYVSKEFLILLPTIEINA